MAPSVVFFAAGLGSRFGGRKQLEPVGPGGATLVEYSAFDALRAGFGRVVFVVDPEVGETLRATAGARIAQRAPVAYVIQRLDALPAGFVAPVRRTRPWGTGQALLSAASQVPGPFAALNADDFYGRPSLALLAAFLAGPASGPLPEYALVGYPLRDTLSSAGPVNRAVCELDAGGWLHSLAEVKGLEPHEDGGRYCDAAGRAHTLPGTQPVSMNLWGFTPPIFDQVAAQFRRFLEDHAASASAEFFLPDAVRSLVAAGSARVRVLEAASSSVGLTHPGDKPRLQATLTELVRCGEYPRDLWA